MFLNESPGGLPDTIAMELSVFVLIVFSMFLKFILCKLIKFIFCDMHGAAQ